MVVRTAKDKIELKCVLCKSFKLSKSPHEYGGYCKKTGLRVTRYKTIGVPATCPIGEGI